MICLIQKIIILSTSKYYVTYSAVFTEIKSWITYRLGFDISKT